MDYAKDTFTALFVWEPLANQPNFSIYGIIFPLLIYLIKFYQWYLLNLAPLQE